MKLVGNATKMLCAGYDCKKRRIKDCNSGKTKSFAIMTYVTIPGYCIDRVTAQNGDRELFERLATPRPAPKVTSKRNWHSQQQQQEQQPISHTHTLYLEKESDLGKQGRSARRPGNRKQFTSQTSVDTHLSDKEVSTNALVKNESVKEELTDTNTTAIERIKIGSKKLYSRSSGEGEDGI